MSPVEFRLDKLFTLRPATRKFISKPCTLKTPQIFTEPISQTKNLRKSNMSKSWSDYSSAEDEALYSESFNLEEEMAMFNEEERLKAAILNLVDDQKSLTSQFQQREKVMMDEIAFLKEQLCNERKLRQKAEDGRFQVSKNELKTASQARAENVREKTLERELAEVKRLREKDRDAFNKRGLEMASEMAEVKLMREKDRDSFKQKEHEMASRVKAANDREKAMERQLAEVTQLREKDRESFNNKDFCMTTDFIKRYDGKVQEMQAEMDSLKEKLFAKETEVKSFKDKIATLTELQNKWELKKKTLLSSLQAKDAVKLNLQVRLEAGQDEKHALMKRIEGLVQTAELNKTTHEKALGEILTERDALLRNAQERQMFITKRIQKHEQEKSGFLDKIAKLEDVHNQEVEKQSREKQEIATKLKETEEELKTLLNKLHDKEAENLNVSKQLLHLEEEFRALEEKMVRQTEQKAEVDKEIEELQTQIQNTEKNAALESQRWFNEKNGLLEEFQTKLEAGEDDKQALIKKSEELEQKAKQEKSSLSVLIAEAREEEYVLKMKLKRREDELQLKSDTIQALEQELDRKRRKWYQKLLR